MDSPKDSPKRYVIKRDTPRRYLVNYKADLNEEQYAVVTAGNAELMAGWNEVRRAPERNSRAGYYENEAQAGHATANRVIQVRRHLLRLIGLPHPPRKPEAEQAGRRDENEMKGFQGHVNQCVAVSGGKSA